MKTQEPRTERRQTVISDADIERISEAFDRKINGLFEMIGYDTSSHDSRGEIRKDHEFVRDARRAKAQVTGALLISIGGGIGLALWAGFKAVAH